MASWTEINSARFLPAGCVTVAVAFNALGRSIFNRPEVPENNRWTGEEEDLREGGSRPAKTQVGNLHRRGYVFNLMQRLGSSGGLIFVRVNAENGERWQIKAERWNCDRQHAADRFSYAALNTNTKWRMGGTIRPWDRDRYLESFDEPFYVDSRSLVQMLKVIDERWPDAAATVAAGGDYSDILLAEALGGVKNDTATAEVAARASEGSPPTRPKPFLTKDQTEQWYRDRKTDADNQRRRYSRPEDEAAGRLVGIGRERVRELRNMIAPDWAKKDGRPPKAGG